MIIRPRFKANYFRDTVPGEGVFLLSEKGPVRLDGAAFERVVGQLDGRRTADEIVEAVAPDLGFAQSYYAFDLLERGGYIEEHEDRLSAEEAAFWAELSVPAGRAAQRLATLGVSVAALGGIDIEPLRDALHAMHIRHDGNGDLSV